MLDFPAVLLCRVLTFALTTTGVAITAPVARAWQSVIYSSDSWEDQVLGFREPFDRPCCRAWSPCGLLRGKSRLEQRAQPFAGPSSGRGAGMRRTTLPHERSSRNRMSLTAPSSRLVLLALRTVRWLSLPDTCQDLRSASPMQTTSIVCLLAN